MHHTLKLIFSAALAVAIVASTAPVQAGPADMISYVDRFPDIYYSAAFQTVSYTGGNTTTVLYQDELVTAFRDVQPQAPTHILVVPNKPVPTVADVTDTDEAALGRMIRVAARLAEEEGIDQEGYRLIINCRAHGGQEVYHVHLHLVGGRPLGRMLPD